MRDKMRTIVFDIGGTAIKFGICSDGHLESASELPTQAKLGGRHILNTVAGLIERETSRGGAPFDGIGVSTAGQIDAAEGSVIYANQNIPDYTGMQIRRELEARFHLPTAVENDVNSAAIGEAVYGGAKDVSSFLCLTYGTGIGGAIIENRAVYHGSGGCAGEFGSIVTHADAAIAGGSFTDGCYERFASATALVAAAVKYDSRLSDGRKIFAALDDPQVVQILDSWVDEVLCGLSSLIHIFHPSCVILGGGIMSQPLIHQTIAARRENYLMPSFSHVKILPALLGNRAGLLGIHYLTEERIRQGRI